MNLNKKIRLITLFILMIALPLYLLAQSETIIINNADTFKEKSRTPVTFPHANHMTLEGVSCTDCHHRFEKGKNILDASELTEKNKSILCGSCHKGKSNLETAYHHQCIGCHDGKKRGKPAGPRMCGECHKRNK
jgi:c(7)-type cytochrome triheme protein